MNAPVICQVSRVVAPRLAEIELECNRPPWVASLFDSEFDQAHAHILAARMGGIVVGFLLSHHVLDEGHIVNFGVASTARGKGVGRALLSQTLEDLGLRGVHWVTLEVRKSNRIARVLYESCGFSEVGVRTHYYTDDGEDAVVMSANVQDFMTKRKATL